MQSTTRIAQTQAQTSGYFPGKMKLKLLVDGSASKVLYAEVDKEFVDFLVSLLLMQVGPAARMLGHDRLAGSLGELYGSLEALGLDNWMPNIDRVQVFRPAPPAYPALQKSLLMMRYDGMGPSTAVGGTGYVKGSGAMYMVTDELAVTPLATEGIVKALRKVKDVASLEEREVEFGTQEALDLLKHSLNSRLVFTKLFLERKKA